MRYSFNGSYPVTRPFGVYGPEYSNYPGSRHPGTDYGLPANTPVVAGMSGTVQIFLSTAKIGRGNEVWITDGAYSRRVCHLNRVDVQNGQQVTEGQPIGLSGFTGYVLDAQGKVGTPGGAHLHDELLVNGQYVDVDKFLKEEDVAVITTEAVVALSIATTGKQPSNAEEEKYINKPATQENLDGLITYWAGRSRLQDLEKALANTSSDAQTKLDAIKKLLS